MKKRLEFHPETAQDIKSSFDWYEEKLLGLGHKFLDELESGYIAIQNLG